MQGIGRTHWPLTREGEFLAYLREMAIMKKSSGAWYKGIERFARTGMSHIMLGMGNIASSMTLLSRISIPLANDGPEATAQMLNEIKNNSNFYRQSLRILGMEEPVRGLDVEVQNKLAEASFSLYRKSEQVIMPTVFGARYFKLRSTGASHVDAIKEGILAVRQVRTALDYDIPALLRRGGAVGAGIRAAFQYFPFALKSTQYAASLELGRFSEYIGYAFSIAGLKGVPFAAVADRIPAWVTGHSVINTLLADPQFAKVLRGIPGMTAGIDIGARHNWSQSLIDRLIQPAAGPFISYSNGLANALAEFERRQDGYTTINLFKAALPIDVRYLFNALDAEKHGAILDATGRSLVKKPTEQEIVAKGLGFIPVRESQARALQAEVSAEKAPRQRDVRTVETEYRRAIQEGNQDEIIRISGELRKLGLRTQDLLRIRKEVGRPPSERIIRGLPKILRGNVQDLRRRFIESEP
jgi:hypothetical protein